MATAPFQWLGNQAITSPEQAQRKRAIADALIAQSSTPGQNWSEGLADVAAALSGTILGGRVDEAEAAGRERAGGLFANLAINSDPNSIIAALTSPDASWASPAQTSIASSLLSSGLERSDPMYQLKMQTAQAELDALRNPSAGAPEYFGSTLPYEDAQGNLGYVQLNKGGLPALPEGARWLEPTSTVNTGTAQTIVGRNTGAVQGAIPIDNVGASNATAIGGGLGEQSLATIEAGRNAASNNAKLSILEQTLANAPQGAQGGLTQLAGGFGIDLGGLSDVQASQAIINQLVPLQRAPGSGTMSDQDLALYKASLPSIINQPGANQQIIATTKALNDYTIAHAAIEQQLINGQIDQNTALQLKQQIPNPLAGAPKSGNGGDDVDAILKGYGL